MVRAGLESRRLLPALLRFGEEASQALWREQALRYVEFCLYHLHSHDGAVHQLAVALYSLKVLPPPLPPPRPRPALLI